MVRHWVREHGHGHIGSTFRAIIRLQHSTTQRISHKVEYNVRDQIRATDQQLEVATKRLLDSLEDQLVPYRVFDVFTKTYHDYQFKFKYCQLT